MTFLDEPSACAINVNLLANQKNDVTISTSLHVLQYLRPSTRVLTAKYSSTGKEVLDFDEVCLPDRAQRRGISVRFPLCSILRFSLSSSLQRYTPI